MAQYTITGFDASAHMAEETRQASRTAAIGMVMSVVVSVIFGFFLLLAVTFAIPDTAGRHRRRRLRRDLHLGRPRSARRGRRSCSSSSCIAQMFCLTASVTSASRMMYAFSRDRAVPGHRLWRRISSQRVPTYAVLAIGDPVVAADGADPEERRRRLPRRHIDRGDRPLHRVRHSGLPALAGRRQVRARRLAPRREVQVDRRARDRLDRADLHPVHAPDRPGGRPVGRRVRLERRQLRAAHRRRGLPALRRLVRTLGQEVVQGPVRQGTEEELERIEAGYESGGVPQPDPAA